MTGSSVGIEVDTTAFDAARRRLRRLTRDLTAAVRDAAGEIAADEADRIADAAAGDPLSEVVAQGLRVRRDRVPAIVAGGSRRVAALADGRSQLPTYGDLFFGAEFGGQGRPTTRQFRPHRGRDGYWMYPQLRRDADRMLTRWAGAIDEIADGWEAS